MRLRALLGAGRRGLRLPGRPRAVPRQRTLAVTAGLVVAFQPMFAFMSGALNNDAGVNAAAALLVLLLVRGLQTRIDAEARALAIGAVPCRAAAHEGHRIRAVPGRAGRARRDGVAPPRAGRGTCRRTACWARHRSVGAHRVVASRSDTFGRTSFTTPGGISPTASGGIVGNALSDPGLYVSYLWQVFLPRLPFMSDLHPQKLPAFDIYVERGWAAFGWYAVKFPQWVYVLIALALLAGFALCAVAAWRERRAARDPCAGSWRCS